MKYREEYEIALKKYCEDDSLLHLIEQCCLDEFGRREDYYLALGKYPDTRDMLGKLKSDLILMRSELWNKIIK